MRIVSSAPARISFLGGGSDLSEFSDVYGGVVLSMAINLRSHVELLTGDDMWNQKNTFPGNPELCYAIRDVYGVNSMHHSVVKSSFDGFIEAGLGSSGAFSVALVAALEKFNERGIEPFEIAEKAYKIERGVHKTGRQDHYAASYGGANLFTFGERNNSVPLSNKWVDLIYPYMLLTYVGQRKKGKGKSNPDVINSMIKSLPLAIDHLSRGEVLEFIKLVNFSWQLKRELGASNKKIDNLYDKGIVNGALGGKLLGVGGGGYFLFFIEPSKRKEFIKNMKIEVTDFMPDYQGVEARIV